MGVIIGRIEELSDKVNYILKLTEEINTRRLQEGLCEFVYDCFTALKPLSRKFTIVCQIDNQWYTEYLCMGEWLRIKSGSYHKYGSIVDSNSKFFDIIREYGDRLKPHVRRPIKEDFSLLVDLTKQLKAYNNIEVSMTIPKIKVATYSMWNNKLELKYYEVDKMSLTTSWPREIKLLNSNNGKDKESIRVDSEVDICKLEDVIDYVIQMYLKAKNEVTKTKNYNQKIIDKMKKIAEPWIIAKNLS